MRKETRLSPFLYIKSPVSAQASYRKEISKKETSKKETDKRKVNKKETDKKTSDLPQRMGRLDIYDESGI